MERGDGEATQGGLNVKAKTWVVNMADGFDFQGFHIQWRRKPGTNTWHVYTFIADQTIRSLKAKIRALREESPHRGRTDQAYPCHARLGQLLSSMPCACKHTFARLAHLVWWRVAHRLRTSHRWGWKDFRRRFTTPRWKWKPLSEDGTTVAPPRSGPCAPPHPGPAPARTASRFPRVGTGL